METKWKKGNQWNNHRFQTIKSSINQTAYFVKYCTCIKEIDYRSAYCCTATTKKKQTTTEIDSTVQQNTTMVSAPHHKHSRPSPKLQPILVKFNRRNKP